MATRSYHPSTIVDNSPQPTGSRDDSRSGVELPLTEIVHQAPVETPREFRNWPDLHTRLQWANDAGIAHGLSSLERAVLKHVAWRAGKREDGKAPGCWESSANIGTALGYHRNQIGGALAALVDRGLLTANRRFSNSTIHRPTFSRCTETVQMDARKPCTNKKGNKKGIGAEEKEILLVTEEEPPIVDDSDSCGMPGCPFPDRVCPMCGRQGGPAKAAPPLITPITLGMMLVEAQGWAADALRLEGIYGRGPDIDLKAQRDWIRDHADAPAVLDARAAIRASVGVDNRKAERMEAV